MRRALIAALIALAAAGCSGASSTPTHSQQVSQSTFQGHWPVTASSGTLNCDKSKGAGAVTFTPDGSSTTYAVNGAAMSWAKSAGWPDSKEIWNGENWGDFIDTGLKLCN